MKAAIRFLFSICILIPQLAIASHHQNLKSAFDDYTYAMTVEWDQKDREFARSQEILFLNNVKEMIKQGLSKEELRNFFQKENPRINLAQLETELLLIDTSNPEVVSQFISRKMKESYSTGANWLGDVPIEVWGLLSVVVFMLVFSAILNQDSGDSTSTGTPGPACIEYRYETRRHCEPRYDYYNDGAYYEVCYDVTDSYCDKYADE